MTVLNELMRIRGGDQPPFNEIKIIGKDPVLNTSFKIGEVAAATHASVGIAINDLWEMKTGRRQKVAVNVRSAAATLNSNKYIKTRNSDGDYKNLIDKEHEFNRQLNGVYSTKDGRWVLPHFGLNHLRDRMLNLLNASPTKESIAKAVSKWDSFELENAIERHKLCGGTVRTNAEWLTELHGKILSTKPVIEIIKIDSSDPEPIPKGERPLTGIRVLDLTRILAGPIAGRTLAEHGADVLMVTARHTPQVHAYLADTSHGKRSCFLDIRKKENACQLKELVKKADIFSQGYRPGTIDRQGFGAEELSKIRPGLIYISINCYGFDGPYSSRGGWEQVAQIMTGLTLENSSSKSNQKPKLLPAAANDYITGYLGAYGAILALARRAKEGGSYHVRVSLCQTAMMIYRNGKFTGGLKPKELSANEIEVISQTTLSHLGQAKHLAPILHLSETPPFWNFSTPKLGGDSAEWLFP